MFVILFFFFKQKTAYEMRISDWSSDVCSSDLHRREGGRDAAAHRGAVQAAGQSAEQGGEQDGPVNRHLRALACCRWQHLLRVAPAMAPAAADRRAGCPAAR